MSVDDVAFEGVLAWPMPPRRAFYPSACACQRVQWSHCFPRSNVAVRAVIAIDSETHVTLQRAPAGDEFFAGCTHVDIDRTPYYGGRGWFGGER